MTAEVTIEYECADGTPFPVTFASAEDAALEWRLDQEHSVGPSTPLASALYRLGRPGVARAYGEAGLPVPSMWRDGPDANGFAYFLSGLPGGDEFGALVEGCGRLVETYGSALGIWREHSLPRVRSVVETIEAAPAEAPLAELSELQTYAQHHTMVSAMVTWNDMQLVLAMCTPLYGDDAELVALELSQGHDNPTLAADQALWDVAQQARASPTVRAALEADDPAAAVAALRASDVDNAFFSALDAFLVE
jgi:hypothetical protein